MTYLQHIIFCMLSCFPFSMESPPGLENLVITLLSQKYPYHSQQAVVSRNTIQDGCRSQNISAPIVHLAHEEFHHIHHWTIFPLLPLLWKQHGRNASWFLFGSENMNVHSAQMASLLSNLDSQQEVFLGRALRDREPTIIHHFAFHEDPTSFAYPDISAGIIMSASLLASLCGRYSRLSSAPADFSIDPAHELALFVWQEGRGVTVTDPGVLCITPGHRCATSLRPPPPCTGVVDKSSVHFAVKTCSQFHESRLPVVRDTWARDAVNLRYYSDVADEWLGTVTTGVPNTERGHCAKTLRILQLSAELPGLQWLVLADDDTLLSVPRLLSLLACYSAEDPVLVGERYGFRAGSGSGAGYSYITGGGGMAVSVSALRRLRHCRCPGPDAPDDMQLGRCAAGAGVELVHSPRFHQARPPDYPPELLSQQEPISFHKHWMIDPRRVYRTWLEEPATRAEPQRTEL